MQFFNEAEQIADNAENTCEEVREPITKDKTGYKSRDKRSGRDKLLKNLPVVIEEHVLDEDKLECPNCGSKLVPIGKEFVREVIEYICPEIRIKRIFRVNYGCPACRQKGKSYIKENAVQQSVLSHSLASASSVTQVIYEKYVKAVPLYR